MDFPPAEQLSDAAGRGNAARIDSAVRRSGRPPCAVLFPFERNASGALQRRRSGPWTEIKQIADVTIWKRAFGAKTS